MIASGRRSKTDMGLCNCIALYDWDPQTTDLKGWFQYMEKWADHIGIAWESMGFMGRRKLMLYNNAKKKVEKQGFSQVPGIGLLGGVDEPGTNLNWKINSFIHDKIRGESYLLFSNDLIPFQKERLLDFMKKLLGFADFKYGIAYQRDFDSSPDGYAAGALGGKWLPCEEEDRIAAWMHNYNFDDGDYRTGLLRDVYPFNILIDQHLSEKVERGTLESWILSDPTHGTLEKITDQHWLWSIDPGSIPHAQETLQEAGLLLCYKP